MTAGFTPRRRTRVGVGRSITPHNRDVELWIPGVDGDSRRPTSFVVRLTIWQARYLARQLVEVADLQESGQ